MIDKIEPARQSRPRVTEERVTELLEIAAEVFAERGFEGASVGEMARRANASKATFYSRYPTKESLLMAVVSEQIGNLESDLSLIMEREVDLQLALTEFSNKLLTVVLSEQVLSCYRLVTLEAKRFPELGELYYLNGPERISRLLTDYLAAKTRAGVIAVAKPRIAAEQFIDSIVGMPRLRATLGIELLSTRQRKERVTIAVDVFFRAYST